jgi:predicted amidohydrolase
VKVATVQYAPKFKAPDENLRTAISLVSHAVDAGASIIVLPELCLTGYSFMSEEDARPYAEQISDFKRASKVPSMEAFSELAFRNNVAIAWGTLEQDFGTGKLYNSQVLMTPTKHVVCRKLNQWGNDFLWASEGRESPPIMDFMGKKVGTLICRDVRDKGPKWSALKDFYEKGDADIVCFSANFGDGGFPSVSWVEFARMNRVWFIVSNRYGKEANNDFGEGGICIIEPGGKVHCEGLKWNEPCIVYADVP